jgi:hypothetical protein
MVPFDKSIVSTGLRTDPYIWILYTYIIQIRLYEFTTKHLRYTSA